MKVWVALTLLALVLGGLGVGCLAVAADMARRRG